MEEGREEGIKGLKQERKLGERNSGMTNHENKASHGVFEALEEWKRGVLLCCGCCFTSLWSVGGREGGRGGGGRKSHCLAHEGGQCTRLC